jgi:molecular chaperone DnaJ
VAQSDYYEILGVSRDADADEIKKAFRKKARKCHPDVNDAPDAEDQFKKLNEAYDALSDPNKRAQYDRFGSVGSTPGFSGAGGSGGYNYVDLNDLFGFGTVNMADLFSAFMGGTRRNNWNTMRREGRDLSMQVVVTLEDAAQGVTRPLSVDRLATCPDCNGTGSQEGTAAQTCPDCKGTGQKTTVQRTFLGTMQTSSPCPKCQGTGSYLAHLCSECEGSGRVVDRQQVDLAITKGITDGQQIRLRNLGEAGIRGARAGDLIVTVRVAPHKRFERHGADLHMLLPLSFTQAALGATKLIDGLLEEVRVEIPAGLQTGETVKVIGAGMPVYGSEGYGNLYCHIEVVVPRKMTQRQKELVTTLSKEFGDSETSQVAHQKSGFDRVKDWFMK